MRRARLLLAVALAVPLLASCTVTKQWRGDERFVLVELDWTPGETTLQDVLGDVGPPDGLRRLGDRLELRYRFEYHQSSTLLLSAYGMKVFRKRAAEDLDATLLVVVDDEDRLVYYGRTALPDTSLLDTAY